MPHDYGVTAAKAKKILRDKKVRGKMLSAKQKGYFGAVAGGEKPKDAHGAFQRALKKRG